MNQDLERLEHLDRLDRELHRIETERAKLRDRLAGQTATSVDRAKARDEARAALEANKAEERAATRRLQDLQTSRGAALKVLETGVGNAEAAQRQLERCDGLIDEAETGLLELMERQDQLSSALSAAESALGEAQTALTTEREAQPAQLATLERQHGEAAAQRSTVHASIPTELRDRYDGFRERNRWAVARIRTASGGSSCEACSMTVPPQALADLRTNKLVTCHGCHRWLVTEPR